MPTVKKSQTVKDQVADLLDSRRTAYAMGDLLRDLKKHIDANSYDLRDAVWQLVDGGLAVFTDDWRVKARGRRRAAKGKRRRMSARPAARKRI